MGKLKCILVVLAICFMCVTVACCADESGGGAQGAVESTSSDRCGMEPEGGECKALLDRYYYDAESRKCMEFMYGGCGGVVPFDTMEECREACEDTNELHISYQMQQRTSPYGVVEVEYPKSWDDPEFTFYADGEEIKSVWTGGGFDQKIQTASFMLALGEAGVKKIKVVGKVSNNSGEATVTHYWRGPAVLELLNHTGLDEAVFEDGDIQFYAFQVEELKILVNGSEVAPSEVSGDDALGYVFTVRPNWKQGMNTMKVEAQNRTGDIYTTPDEFSKSYSFYYVPEGKIGIGESFSFIYGYPGGKSGPWFEVECDEANIRLSEGEEVTIYTLMGKEWLGEDRVFIEKVEGISQGAAKILVYEKAHFLEHEKLAREIDLEVVPVIGQ